MPLVLGVDSSTQSTKALLVDAEDGTVVEERSAPHPPGTAVDPHAWIEALDHAAGPLLDRAAAVAIGGQQHGAVVLDAAGDPVHDALLWNDVRSAAAARDLTAELGGPEATALRVGSVLNASFTVTKLRWLRDHAGLDLARAQRVLLPHDYLTWHLAGRPEEGGVDPAQHAAQDHQLGVEDVDQAPETRAEPSPQLAQLRVDGARLQVLLEQVQLPGRAPHRLGDGVRPDVGPGNPPRPGAALRPTVRR